MFYPPSSSSSFLHSISIHVYSNILYNSNKSLKELLLMFYVILPWEPVTTEMEIETA